jgi:membrane protease subunit HflC
MTNRGTLYLVLGGVIALLIMMSAFTVRETELAIKFQFGEIVNYNYSPGLHFKLPLVNDVRKFDKRLMTRNYPDESFLTSEGKILRIDFFLKWRIQDVSAYYRATAGNEELGGNRLGEIVKDGLKGAIARRTIQQVVAGNSGDGKGAQADRSAFLQEVINAADLRASELGVRIVDVRVKGINLPKEVSESVFKRMGEDFNRQATLLRAEGESSSKLLRAEADRKRKEVIAEAYREAEIIRGEGDAAAAKLYADAYSKNPEFYSFYRSLQAYRQALGTDDVLVVSPDSEFFRYLFKYSNRP